MNPLEILGYEIVQTIQDTQNSTPIYEQRKTLVRVYLKGGASDKRRRLTGTLTVKYADGSEIEVPAKKAVTLDARGAATREIQRQNHRRAPGFIIDADKLPAGPVWFKLQRLQDETGADINLLSEAFEVNVLPTPRFGLKLIAFHKTALAPGQHALDPVFASALERSLKAMFAVHENLEVKVEPLRISNRAKELLDETSPEYNLSRGHAALSAQLMEKRILDVASGAAGANTLYYGAFEDAPQGMYGAVSNVPRKPRPSIVGVGPGRYRDVLLAVHEIAHMLGCLHPGYPSVAEVGADRGQHRWDLEFPRRYRGMISDDTDQHLGWDHVSNRLMSHKVHYDLMTYMQPAWISKRNYTKIARGIAALDAPINSATNSNLLFVAGYYDNSASFGEILNVTAIPYALPDTADRSESNFVELVNAENAGAGASTALSPLVQVAVEQVMKKSDAPQIIAPFQVSLPLTAEATHVRLRIGDKIVAVQDMRA